MKAIGYARCSTADQAREGVSLDVQEERVRAYCAMAGLNLIAVVREEGVSGTKPLADRPSGKGMLRLLAARKIQHVVALKLDRLFRDAADALTQTRAWDREGVALHLVDMGGQTLNTATAIGRMFLTLTAAFAELERNLISERTTAALKHKKAAGAHIGAPGFGFRVVDHALVPVPEELAIVEEVRRLRADGKTLREIARSLTDRNILTRRGGQWGPEQVRRLAGHPRYTRLVCSAVELGETPRSA